MSAVELPVKVLHFFLVWLSVILGPIGYIFHPLVGCPNVGRRIASKSPPLFPRLAKLKYSVQDLTSSTHMSDLTAVRFGPKGYIFHPTCQILFVGISHIRKSYSGI